MIEAAAHPHTAAPTSRVGRARIALAHDWLCGYRGGEAVLERLAALLLEREFEPAGLYVMFDDGRALSPAVDALRAARRVRPSWPGRLPGSAGPLRRWLLPLYPAAVSHLGRRLARDHRARPIDALVSSSSAAIKGLRPPPGVPHLCYCHSPARYIWSRTGDYGGRGPIGRLRAFGLRAYADPFKRWDRATASHVTRFIANSAHTAAQVLACFGREAAVIHPPVRTDFFTPGAAPREDFWLVVSALEPYKRVDLAIEAARLAGARLTVAGDGSQRGALRRLAGPHVSFLGRVSDEDLRALYRRAAVLLFPQVEDFGIAAVEALACGLPVAARALGGALDILVEGRTGSFFHDPDPAALAEAAARAQRLSPGECHAAAQRFSPERFDAQMLRAIHDILPAR